jgi:xylulokinase
MGERRWDEDWIRALHLPADIFPPAYPSGTPLGRVHADGQRGSGLPVGTPVAVAGHDHICGALAAGAVIPKKIFDSMGTAEALLGTLDPRPLTQADFASGLSFGCHVVPGCNYWLGGLSASGGSIEWLREMFGKDQITYRQIDELLEPADYSPVDILYFPYLLGSSSSSLNRTLSTSKAAFIGLDARHRQIDLFKAVLQGTAYEMERIRRTAEQLTASTIERMLAAGGGTRNKYWMQVKADVSNCVLEISPFTEVTLLGAAMVAGIGTGVFSSADEAISAMVPRVIETFLPDAHRHRQHRRLYEEGYLVLQQPLNHYYSTLDRVDNS